MSPLRWTLVALLVASTALFAAGVISERSDADRHAATSALSDEHGEAGEAAEGAHGAEDETGEVAAENDEAVLGIDVESTPLIVLAALAGLALAVIAATRLGQRPAVLLVIALIALAWAALDIRELFHQADESRTGIALVAAAAAIVHLAAAAVAAQARHADVGSRGRPGTMPA